MTQPEIQQEIEQTRERLGQTVEELVAKTDLKARARDKAAGLKVQARDKAAGLKAQARDKAAGLKAQARDKAAGLKAQARDKGTDLSARVRQRQIVQRRWPLAVAAGGLAIVASVAFWRRRTK